MAVIGDALTSEGICIGHEAHQMAVMHATWVFGSPLMHKTGRLRPLHEDAGPMLDRYLGLTISRRQP